jgi:hypothetical protein
MEIYDIVKKLIGNVVPIGDTNKDLQRYKNLEETIFLIEQLLQDINSVSSNKDCQEYSKAIAGKKAEQFLNELFNRGRE